MFCKRTEQYRYGYNGKEKTDEVNGSGVVYDYGFRIYDTRTAKFLSTDPLFKSYPWLTPYQFASNDPIRNIDVDGLEGGSSIEYMFRAISNDLEGSWTSDFSSTTSSLPNTAPNKTAPAVKPNLTKPIVQKTDEEKIDNQVNNGDPLAEMEILPISGDVNKGRHGFTRKNGGQFHDGIDLRADPGTPVYAVADGKIEGPVVSNLIQGVPFRQPGNNGNGAGNRLYLKSGKNKFGYWHLSTVGVNPTTGNTYKPGDIVKVGDVLGQTGSTGNANAPGSAGPHLHFQQTTNGKSTNPETTLNTKFDSNGKAITEFNFTPSAATPQKDTPTAVTTYH